LKIAFIHSQDINDKNLWSGTIYYLFKNLVKNFDDVVLYKPKGNNSFIFKLFFGGIEYLTGIFKRKRCLNFYNSYFLPRSLSRSIDSFIKRNPVDCIITTTNSPFIYTENKTPLIIITDATVKLLYKEYSEGKGMADLYYENLEKSALKVTLKSALIVSSSTATSHSLISDYNIPLSKITIIPFGANIDDEDIQVSQKVVDKSKRVNILFVGKDWERKGGDFAVTVCDILIKQKITVQLTIVGCKVPEKFQRNYIKNYIYLDKNKKDDFKKLRELYVESHFLMGFSKAEMYGIVFCEAAAYGLPVVTYSVGGITDIVVNEKTGVMLPIDTKQEIFALKIVELILNPEKYLLMSDEARKRYETLLNWNTFMDTLKSKIQGILNQITS
jgi:glycosyltransferase involved in cell wall biosynthesis